MSVPPLVPGQHHCKGWTKQVSVKELQRISCAASRVIFLFGCWGIFGLFVCLGFGLVLSFWWLKAICFSDMFSRCTCGLAQRGGHPSMALLAKGWSSHNWRKRPSNRSIMYFIVGSTKQKKKTANSLGTRFLCLVPFIFSLGMLCFYFYTRDLFSRP